MKHFLRPIVLLACVITLINAIMLIGLSVYHSVKSYIAIFHGEFEEYPGVGMVESLDGFLMSLVFIIFAVGFGKLFIPDYSIFRNINIPWLNPKNFTELKVVLWETILTTLVVLFAIHIVRHLDELKYEMLILPAAVMLIAVGLHFMHLRNKH